MGKYKYSEDELQINKILKMNLDESNELLNDKEIQKSRRLCDENIDKTEKILKAFNKEVKINKSDTKPLKANDYLNSWDDLVREANNRYPDLVEIEDILTEEEIADVEQRYDEIEKEFRKKTRLNKADYIFLTTAIVLQIIRQAVQPSLDFESLMPSHRPNDKDAAKYTDKSLYKEKIKKYKDKISKNNSDINKTKRYYYASLDEICNLAHVPYDAIIPGLSGVTHRFKTLGHDPVLGYLFGTCNILTNTLTTSDMITVHIKNNRKVANANTAMMLNKSLNRFEENGGKEAITIALVKQAYHINSDKKSKAGIGLPFFQFLMSEKCIRKLCESGIDYNALQFGKAISEQALLAEFINRVIAISHRIYIFHENYQKYCENKHLNNITLIIEEMKKIDFKTAIFGEDNLNEVRTRKILLISNTVASSANILYTSIVTALDCASGNGKGVYDSLKKLDVGGILVTLVHLISDKRIIAKIKDDFIKKTLQNDFDKYLSEIEENF